MDRLYSQYPAGAVGAALLLLRIIVGAWFARDGISMCIAGFEPKEPAIAIFIGVSLVAMALLLLFGARTSFAGIAGAALALAGQFYSRGDNWFYLLLLALLAASLALLGPGGYSMDARLSGWRTITFTSRITGRKD